jgi:hypothetical protein
MDYFENQDCCSKNQGRYSKKQGGCFGLLGGHSVGVNNTWRGTALCLSIYRRGWIQTRHRRNAAAALPVNSTWRNTTATLLVLIWRFME